MTKFKFTFAVLAFASLTCTAHAQLSMPMAASPEEVGLSSSQFKKIEAVTKAHINDGLMPGAVMLVARRGKVAWVSVQGKLDSTSTEAMKLDSIFRIYSMTKPIVSVTLMQLVEEGRLQISDPVSKYLPEIGKMKVGTEVAGEGGKTTFAGSWTAGLEPTRSPLQSPLVRGVSSFG